MRVCGFFCWSHGLCFWLLRLHCFLLFDCINGASNAVELWTCVSGCLCFKEEKRPSKSSSSQLVCCWRLGDGHVITCSCMLISRGYSSVRKRPEVLRGTRSYSMLQVRDFSSFGFHHLGFNCHIISCDVLDLSLRLDNWMLLLSLKQHTHTSLYLLFDM